MHQLFYNTNINYSNYKTINYKKNDIVFNEGAICNYLGLVISGNINIVTFTYNEKEYQINSINENSIFGQNILFQNQKYLGTGIATKETTVLYISKNELLELFTNSTFTTNFLTLTTKITLNLQKKIKLLSQKEIRDKIIFLLLENARETQKKAYFFESKEKLAQFLNITRPSLSRELIKMKRENLIDFDKHYIILKNN